MRVMEEKLKATADWLKFSEGRPILTKERQLAKKYLLQSLSKDFCFHKGYLTVMRKYDKNIDEEEEKRKRGKIKMKF